MTARHQSFVLAAALFLAGCLSSTMNDAEAEPSDGPAFFRPPVAAPRLPDPQHDFDAHYDGTHGGNPQGHADPGLHAHRFGLELVGYNPLTRLAEGGVTASFIAMDTWKDEKEDRYYACITYWATGDPGGAIIVDATDAEAPRPLGEALSGMTNSDCQFTDDGRYLLLGAYVGLHDGLPAPPPAGDLLAYGVVVYDVSDKANPRFLFHDTTGATQDAYHNVFTAQINGTHYVFQTYTGNILALEPGADGLRLVSTVDVADHDMWVGHHPVTGEWVMITGARPGVIVYNVDDPANPVPLGIWQSENENYTGWHRQWPLENTVDGRALMVVAGEEFSAAEPWYTVLDFTDPDDLTELGHWTLPNARATQHEFEVWDGYVATGNYHQGVWLFDVGSMDRAMDPVTLGFYLPHEDPEAHGGITNTLGPFSSYQPRPYVWGAYFDARGYVYAADYVSGLYILRFEATTG